MNDISIIIPTFNRPDDLACVLPYYFKQKGALEIIIIDDNSSASYTHIIEKYTAFSDVKLIYKKNKFNMGAGACRNIGVSLAKGKYILWGEDDAFLSDNYTEILKRKIINKEIVFGSIYYGIHPSMQKALQESLIKDQQQSNHILFNYKLLEGYYRLATDKDIVVPWGHALFMINKNAYKNITYFEGYKVNGYREETDAQVQMTKNGYKVIYTPDTCCYHFPAKNNKGGQHHSSLFVFEYYKIKNNAIFLNRHYTFLKEKYHLDESLWVMKYLFTMHCTEVIFHRFINKILRIAASIKK